METVFLISFVACVYDERSYVIETHEHKSEFKEWLAANPLNFSKHKQQNDSAHGGDDKLS